MDVKGKVVLCVMGGLFSRVEKGEEVKNAGGAAMILVNQKVEEFSGTADTHVLPTSRMSYDAALKIQAYMNSTSTPTATIIFKGTIIGNKLAPEVTSFSSRGPSRESPGILKPDIIGPGVSILAAWPVSVDGSTNSNATFFIASGTSKSSIMTTADLKNLGGQAIVDETHQVADLFATGAGHVNPLKANDPGLVYDIQPEEYIPYLCGLGYSDIQVSIIAKHTVQCSQVKRIPEAQLNYPSFSLLMGMRPKVTLGH